MSCNSHFSASCGPLPGLLLEQRINLGVTAIRIAPACDGKGFEPRGGIPRRATGPRMRFRELFLPPGGERIVARSTVRILTLIPTALRKFATPSA